MSCLQDMIHYLEYGTHLHIGVLFLGNHGNPELMPSKEHTIHSAPFCRKMKESADGMRRCYRCRNAAVRKALRTRAPFGGRCINGLFEYTYPVLRGERVVAIIFVGNIADGSEGTQGDFTEEDCHRVCALIEQLIHSLWTQEHTDLDPLTENMKSFIEDNLCISPDLSAMAALFHYNEKYLGRRFKQKTGVSVSRYCSTRRLERAAEMLRAEGRSVIGIAEEVGFNNVTYFNRLFKSHFGCTPTEYKKDR